jgi:hypothetical protein
MINLQTSSMLEIGDLSLLLVRRRLINNDSASLACLSNSPGQALRRKLAWETPSGLPFKINK